MIKQVDPVKGGKFHDLGVTLGALAMDNLGFE
jgi:hypothetical protein